MVYLTLEDILAIRDRIAAAYNDSFEITAPNGLMSALAAPRRSAFGAEAFPTLAEKAGALVYGLVQNHPFWDGNKRIASAALRLFIQRNGAELVAGERAIEIFTTVIARGKLRDSELAQWVGEHIEYKKRET
jgi:death-on-curing protein